MTRAGGAGHLNLTRTRAVLEAGVVEGWHLGAQLAVQHREHGEACLSVGCRRPGEPMTHDTLMLWMSAGKPITALAVARQVERGVLALDTPVAAWIPEFAVGGKEAVTLRHLLTHTGGFRVPQPFPEDWEWSEAVARACALEMEAGVAPGQVAAYQPHATWQILAEVVVRVTGEPFAEHVRRVILEPLGMLDTWLAMPVSVYRAYGARMGTTYVTFPKDPVPQARWDSEEACGRCRPGSSARGPVRDLVRFHAAMRDAGAGIISSETWREFTRPQRVGSFDRTFQHVVDFGLGWLLNSVRSGGLAAPYGYGERASPEAFGHSGAQSSCGFADPARGLAVAWVCNGMPGEPRHQRRVRAIHAALEEDLGF